MILTTVALDPDLHRRLSLASIEENAAVGELLRQAARAWLERRDRPRKPKGGSR
jgi:hypothetical protein